MRLPKIFLSKNTPVLFTVSISNDEEILLKESHQCTLGNVEQIAQAYESVLNYQYEQEIRYSTRLINKIGTEGRYAPNEAYVSITISLI